MVTLSVRREVRCGVVGSVPGGDGLRMHLPYESRGRRRREMVELEPWWMQSIIDETRAEHPDLGNHRNY